MEDRLRTPPHLENRSKFTSIIIPKEGCLRGTSIGPTLYREASASRRANNKNTSLVEGLGEGRGEGWGVSIMRADGGD